MRVDESEKKTTDTLAISRHNLPSKNRNGDRLTLAINPRHLKLGRVIIRGALRRQIVRSHFHLISLIATDLKKTKRKICPRLYV